MKRPVIALCAALALLGGLFVVTAGSASAAVSGSSANEFAPSVETNLQIPRSSTIHHVDASGVPRPAGNALVVDSSPSGFAGLTHVDQRTADGKNQFSLEPPDQGLCVGNGVVIQTVNDVLRISNTAGGGASTVALNPFFGRGHQIIRATAGPPPTPAVFGPFISDPKCLFDVPTGRFFVTALDLDTDPATGAFGTHTHVDIAVSTSSTPGTTPASWNVFFLDTTNDGTGGTPSHANCPCLPDQPLIGADANGFYISTNEFGPIPSFAHFNGAQVIELKKASLVAGALVTVKQFNTGTMPAPDGGTWFSVQPATVPGSTYATNTEYFLSALDFSSDLDNRIAFWTLSGTNTAAPSLSVQVIESEVYGQPPAAFQKMGSTPLGDLVHSPLELLNSNDDRMNQVVFAHGLLWSGVNTVVQTPNGPTRVGIAWFAVSPTTAAVTNQGYVAVNNENVLFPSIGVSDSGMGVISFSVVGPEIFPSTGYAKVNASGASDVHISGAGVLPEDGFSGYMAFGGGGTARWGDYSAAVFSDGKVWLAAEYIPGGPRTLFANWGTFVTDVAP